MTLLGGLLAIGGVLVAGYFYGYTPRRKTGRLRAAELEGEWLVEEEWSDWGWEIMENPKTGKPAIFKSRREALDLINELKNKEKNYERS